MFLWSDAEMKALCDKFEKYVPVSGAAETKGGELVRAVMRIVYRYYNDGDQIALGYGNETCTPAARYIMANYEGTEMYDVLDALWELADEEQYGIGLDKLVAAVNRYLDENSELFEQKNDEDMWSYALLEDRWYEEDDEDEEDEEEYSFLHPYAVYEGE